jgi:hypothetical protein
MKTWITILTLIPLFCFAGTDIVVNAGEESSLEIISSDNSKTSMMFSLSGINTESVVYRHSGSIRGQGEYYICRLSDRL